MPDASFTIDQSTEFGARVARHLRTDTVVWLTTVTPGGLPQPSPVWFLWDGAATVSLYSLGGSLRERNLAANARVSLNFAGDGRGGDIVVLSGTAELLDPIPDASTVPAEYLAKYASGIARLGMTPDRFVARYNRPVRISLTGLRGF